MGRGDANVAAPFLFVFLCFCVELFFHITILCANNATIFSEKFLAKEF